MKKIFRSLFVALTLLTLSTLNSQLSTLHAQGTAFTYQGRLNSGGNPANGTYNLTFTLFNTNASGVAIAGPVTNSAVSVTNGLFTTLVDFGNAFNGTSNWLEIAVSTNGANNFVTLAPRQQLTPVPYAITAQNLASVIMNNTIGGGDTVGGGYNNAASNYNSTISGGANNIASGNAATVSGGSENAATGDHTVIGGGQNNSNNGDHATISGGYLNYIDTNVFDSFIGGGIDNTDHTSYAVIGGGQLNTLDAYSQYSVIGGGGQNIIQSDAEWATISGGANNAILTPNGSYASIGGGHDNTNGGYLSVIAGGDSNEILIWADHSVIGGGYDNLIVGSQPVNIYSTIGGGFNNQILTNTTYATIGGGFQNIIQPNVSYSTIPGGYQNQVSGNYSLAAGYEAQSPYAGDFVWASGNARPFLASLANSVQFYATNGFGVYAGPQLNNSQGSNWVYLCPQSLGGGQAIATSTGAFLSASGTWVNNSDRNLKEHFRPVNLREVLDRVAALPISEWNYKADAANQKHIGPMAQDFYAAFQLDGADDKHIATVDESGVALAAIQGLNQKLNEKDAEIQNLEKKLDELQVAVKQLVAKK